MKMTFANVVSQFLIKNSRELECNIYMERTYPYFHIFEVKRDIINE